jgi:hypothetical protein
VATPLSFEPPSVVRTLSVQPARECVFRDASNTPERPRKPPEADHLGRKGELKVLGIRVAATSVRKVLLEAGLRPAPQRTRLSWRASCERKRQALLPPVDDQLRQREDSPLLSPNTPGGHLDFRNFIRRHWKPVQKSVGIDPLRDL